MALLSAIAGVWTWDGDNNIFTQIGLVVLVGLVAKDSILSPRRSISLFAHRMIRKPLRTFRSDAVAFIPGVVPLTIATGAEMRQAMGVAVFAGMLGVTLFGLILTPVFRVVVRRLAKRRRAGSEAVPVVVAAE